MSKTIKIGGRIESAERGGVVTGANAILDDTKGKKQNVINSETDAELARLDSAKQDVLTFDNVPTENSANPVKSGGVYAADAALQQAIEAILQLIPSAATALNQLADKAFVNSTVATDTATFRGTYNVVTDLSLHYNSTHQEIATALLSVVQTADNNDYCFVQIPVSDSSGDIRVTERYKFNGTAWSYEYDLNNSGFTADQWAAINSTITLALVQKLGALPTAAELAQQLALKQNTLTFDTAPVAGSSNPVTSGGLYNIIAAINATIPSGASVDNKLVSESRLTQYVAAIVNALDATFNVTSTDGHVNVRLTQVDGVITSVEVVTNDIASSSALNTLAGRVTTNEGDIAQLQALYNALQQSAPVIIQPTDTWPVASPSATVIYRVIDRVNTPPQYYSDYMFSANDLTTPVLMAQYNNAIDDEPTAGSENLVKSGGVYTQFSQLQQEMITPLVSIGEKFTIDVKSTQREQNLFLQFFTVKRGVAYRFVFTFEQGEINHLSNIKVTNGSFDLANQDIPIDTETLILNVPAQDNDVENCYIRFYNATSYDEVKIGVSIFATSGDLFSQTESNSRAINKLQEDNASLVHSVNLFDKNSVQIISGKYIGPSGYISTEGYFISHPIPVESGVTYRFTVGGGLGSNRSAAKVDADGNYISSVTVVYDSGDTTGTVTPNFNGFLAFNLGGDYSSTMFCKNDEYPESYIPYYTMVSSDYKLYAPQLMGEIPSECLPDFNPLYGKILAVDGDSVCYGAGYVGGYAKIIGEKNNMIVQNRGVGGATISAETYHADQTPRHWVCRDIQNLRADADYILLEGGVNSEGPIGQITNGYTATLDDTTFAGAFESMLKQAIHRFPGKKVGFIFVHKMNTAFSSNGDSTNRYYIAKACCEKWGVSFCDLNTQCPPLGLLPDDDALRLAYTKDGDGWHPNEDGYKKYYCNLIEAWMKTL